jgi:hypothetical protein
VSLQTYPIIEVLAISVVFLLGWIVMVKRVSKVFADWYIGRIRAKAIAKARMMYES